MIIKESRKVCSTQITLSHSSLVSFTKWHMFADDPSFTILLLTYSLFLSFHFCYSHLCPSCLPSVVTFHIKWDILCLWKYVVIVEIARMPSNKWQKLSSRGEEQKDSSSRRGEGINERKGGGGEEEDRRRVSFIKDCISKVISPDTHSHFPSSCCFLLVMNEISACSWSLLTFIFSGEHEEIQDGRKLEEGPVDVDRTTCADIFSS